MQISPKLSKQILIKYKKRDLPCLSDTVIKLSSLDPDSEYSVEELTNIILEDIGLTSKVLKTVNSFYYRRTGKEVSTVTQAILFLGFNAIREIALNMAVLDLAEKGENNPLVQILLSSFVAAHLAQSLVEDNVQKRETIFVNCLFYSLGRIVLCLYEQELYRKFLFIENKDPIQEGNIKKILGELGRGFCELWGLPPSIKENMEGICNRSNKDAAIIENCHIITRAILNENQRGVLSSTIKELSDLTKLSVERLSDNLTNSIKETLMLSKKFKNILSRERLNKIFDKIGRHLPKKDIYSIDNGADNKSINNFLNFLTQLTSLIAQKTFTLDQIYLFATEALLRGIPADRVLLVLLTRDRKWLKPRYAIGKDVKFLKENFKCRFPPTNPTLKSIFETNKAGITIWSNILHNITNSNRGFSPEKIVSIAPIIVLDKPIGCFLIDRNFSTDKFNKEDLMKFEAIRDLVVLGTQKR